MTKKTCTNAVAGRRSSTVQVVPDCGGAQQAALRVAVKLSNAGSRGSTPLMPYAQPPKGPRARIFVTGGGRLDFRSFPETVDAVTCPWKGYWN